MKPLNFATETAASNLDSHEHITIQEKTMGIIHQTDKRSGITYAYESISHWDKEKHQSRAQRRLIGRVSEDGTIIPTDGRCSRNPGHVKKDTQERPRSHDSDSTFILWRDLLCVYGNPGYITRCLSELLKHKAIKAAQQITIFNDFQQLLITC